MCGVYLINTKPLGKDFLGNGWSWKKSFFLNISLHRRGNISHGLNVICVINIFCNILTKLVCEGGDCWVWVTGFVVGLDQYSLDKPWWAVREARGETLLPLWTTLPILSTQPPWPIESTLPKNASKTCLKTCFKYALKCFSNRNYSNSLPLPLSLAL